MWSLLAEVVWLCVALADVESLRKLIILNCPTAQAHAVTLWPPDLACAPLTGSESEGEINKCLQFWELTFKDKPSGMWASWIEAVVPDFEVTISYNHVNGFLSHFVYFWTGWPNLMSKTTWRKSMRSLLEQCAPGYSLVSAFTARRLLSHRATYAHTHAHTPTCF